jgi:integrase
VQGSSFGHSDDGRAEPSRPRRRWGNRKPTSARCAGNWASPARPSTATLARRASCGRIAKGCWRSGGGCLPAADADKAGIDKKISPHKLRHTYATNLLNAGAERVDLQVPLGHESIATTQIYTHVGQERMEKVVSKL